MTEIHGNLRMTPETREALDLMEDAGRKGYTVLATENYTQFTAIDKETRTRELEDADLEGLRSFVAALPDPS